MHAVKVVLFFGAVIFAPAIVDATRCIPFSRFRIDCDICQCSEDGTTYACDTSDCEEPIFENPNANEQNGLYKSTNNQEANDEIPYINDEIPPSREITENEFSDYERYNKKNENGEDIEDVGGEEVDISNDLPEDYRPSPHLVDPYYKRAIFSSNMRPYSKHH